MQGEQKITKHINFEALNPFTGNNENFAKQLIAALLSEMQHFLTTIKEAPSPADIEIFRNANHRITPSLKMLEMHMLIEAISAYKNACMNDSEDIAACARNVSTLLLQVIDEAKQWTESQI